MVNSTVTQAAPGRLEDVRTLLNTWVIPNDTRTPEDRFAEFARARGLTTSERAQVRSLRDDLRATLAGAADTSDTLNSWIERLDIRPLIAGDAVTYYHRGGAAGDLVATCLDALATGRWPRLKACPDCRWVFYDRTRNASKRWCLMTAGGSEGRSCGSIAKVRAHRERQRRRSADVVGPPGRQVSIEHLSDERGS